MNLTAPVAVLLLAALAAPLAAPSAAPVEVRVQSPCIATLAAMERPPGVLFAPDTLDTLEEMAEQAAAFADIGNEDACATRLQQIVAIIDQHLPDESMWEEHVGRLQASRPLRPGDEVDGAEVWSPRGDWLGEAERFVLAPDRTAYLLVSRGGWFSPGRGIVAVPVERVRIARDDALVVPVTEETFRSAPAVEDEADFAATDAWVGPVDRFWRDARS